MKFGSVCSGIEAASVAWGPLGWEAAWFSEIEPFPDNYTNIPWRKKSESPDGPRYKALGNSWAVPVVRWIGERIDRAVD
jgi:site-specific DNA-cytosine methylase